MTYANYPDAFRRRLYFTEVIPMAHTITDDCTNCAACEDSCPVNSISEQGNKRVIDADTCIDCGACVDTCPVNAIHA